MTHANAGPIEVDVCEGGCGGIWFDAFEMQKVDQPEEGGMTLLDIARDPSVEVDLEVRRDCPKCDGIVMLRHPHKNTAEAIIDECPNCGGFWLDAGELEMIRTSYVMEKKHREYTHERLEALKKQSMAGLHEQSHEKRKHTITQLQSFFAAWPE